MLVSIISPSFNCEKFIRETYESIKNQTHNDWEWLVTDDCSTDSSWQILTEIAEKDPRVKLSRNAKNAGAAVSRNNSIERAQGEFLAFLDTDDLWLPSKLTEHLQFMLENDASISFTSYGLIDEQSNDIPQVVDAKLAGAFSYQDMLCKRATMGCCTVMVKASDFDDLTMPLIRAGQDYALWLKLLKTGKQAVIFPKMLSKYRLVTASLSANKVNKAKKTWTIYRKIEKLNLFSASWAFVNYAYRAFFKVNYSKRTL